MQMQVEPTPRSSTGFEPVDLKAGVGGEGRGGEKRAFQKSPSPFEMPK